jgi:hypothetical protein
LHTLTAHKVSYNTHWLFVFSEGDINFELLFTTLTDKSLALDNVLKNKRSLEKRKVAAQESHSDSQSGNKFETGDSDDEIGAGDAACKFCKVVSRGTHGGETGPVCEVVCLSA